MHLEKVFMQLKSRHRREVVEEILDIQIFSTMNLLLRNKIKTLLEDINNIEHEHNLMESKIGMQESHIMSMRENKDKIIQQKQTVIKENESETC